MAGDEDPEPESLAAGATPKPASRKENVRNVRNNEVNEAASAFSWRNKDDQNWTTAVKIRATTEHASPSR